MSFLLTRTNFIFWGSISELYMWNGIKVQKDRIKAKTEKQESKIKENKDKEKAKSKKQKAKIETQTVELGSINKATTDPV